MHVDSLVAPAISDPLAALEHLSHRCDAVSIAADVQALRRDVARCATPPQISQCALRLCARLRHHLVERRSALDRPDHENLERCNSLTVARVLAHAVVELHSQNLRLPPDDLIRWLATERTKFLMATRVDALIALTDSDPETIARHHLALFARKVFAGADRSLAQIADDLLVELAELVDDDVVPFDALASFELSLGHAFEPTLVTLSTPEATLIAHLEQGSRELINRALADHEVARYALAGRLIEQLDSAHASLQLAADVADEVASSGSDAMARERARLAAWTADLSDIVANLA
jgi:hypothetical protein